MTTAPRYQILASPNRLAKYLHLSSIKGKFFVIFALTFLSIGALTALNVWNLSMLKTRMLLGERYDDLLNNILEVRRFEKNFLIYGDSQSLSDSKEYLSRIDALVNDLSEDLPLLDGQGAFLAFKNSLSEYRLLVEDIGTGKRTSPEQLRNIGKILTDSADRYRGIKRNRIHGTIDRTSILPFAFLGTLFLLMVLIFWIISHGLLKPLDLVMETTRLVGRGDFSPIHYDGIRLEEISGLIEAFNRMAQELETNQEDLIQARKIAAIGTFTAGIAHELNNPINNIVLTAESFCEVYGERMDTNCSEMLQDILSQAERAADIVKNVLDFSRTENPVFSELSPKKIIKSTISLVKNQFVINGLHLETSIAENLPLIRGNLGNLQQVFANLLLNAIQATAKGGTVSINVEMADTSGYIKFTVEDTGPGIPAEIRHKIFEPFFSTKEVGKGTGLGLSVSYAIVKRHGGRIDVSSETDRGTKFTVLLPYISRDFEGWTAA